MSEPGTVEVLSLTDADGARSVQINRADARIFVTQEFLDDLADNPPTAWSHIQHGEGLLRLTGINGSALYRLDEFYGPGRLVPDFYCGGPGWTASLIRSSLVPVVPSAGETTE